MTIWTTKHLIMRPDQERAAQDFIQSVQDSEPHCDFSRFARAWVWLPELHSQRQELGKRSVPLEEFLASLQDLMARYPMHGLKILTILCCNEICAEYPKSLTEGLMTLLAQSVEATNMPRRAALEWGIHCWRHWPNRNCSRAPDALVAPLLRQLVAEAEVAPDRALDVFLGLQQHRTGFGHAFGGIFENAWDVVRLGRMLWHQEPRILVDSLQSFLRNARQAIAGYQAGDDKIRLAANELYGIVRAKLATDLPEREAALVSLVLYAFPDEPWYGELFDWLWAIEAGKTGRNDVSFKNLAILSVNCGSNARVRVLAEDAFLAAAMDYQHIDRDLEHSMMHSVRNVARGMSWSNWLEPEPMERHALMLIDAVNAALHDQYPQTRNRSLPVPRQCGIVDHAIGAYWSLVDWLKLADPRLYFQLLIIGIENTHFHTAPTDALELLAAQRLMDGFADYAGTDVQGGIDLFAFMLSRSGFTTGGPKLKKILDQLYPLYQAVDATAAHAAVDLGKQFDQPHMVLWCPWASLSHK